MTHAPLYIIMNEKNNEAWTNIHSLLVATVTFIFTWLGIDTILVV